MEYGFLTLYLAPSRWQWRYKTWKATEVGPHHSELLADLAVRHRGSAATFPTRSVKRVAGAVGEGSVTVGLVHRYLADSDDL
jgi:hypothetical protein